MQPINKLQQLCMFQKEQLMATGKNVLKKLNVQSRTDRALEAIRKNIVSI
jgi:hypothetical protein